MNLFHSIRRLFNRRIRRSLQTTPDLPFYLTPAAERDRPSYDREEVLQQALDAWRANPLARRIVGLTSQYVVGGGVRLVAEQPAAQAFLNVWWQHPLNQCGLRIYEWSDELTRAGELFFLLSSDAAGMSYVRAIPAAQISNIETEPNDIQQESAYHQVSDAPGETIIWQAYDPVGDDPRQQVMLHFAINRPPGAVRGESDLAPLLVWLNRYAVWLEDRARLNRYRNAFYFVVKARFLSEAERSARQTLLNSAPPTPGSILVTDESEQWDVIHPRLESHEAGSDGLSIKKMIAAGAGIPLHFLAEPESATRTTAEAAGGPTFRHFEQRQLIFSEMLCQLARACLRRRACYDPAIDPDSRVSVQTADLSARDNAALAIATQAASQTFFQLFDRGLIDRQELLRMLYRFAGEVAGEAQTEPAANDPARRQEGSQRAAGKAGSRLVNPESGETRGIAAI